MLEEFRQFHDSGIAQNAPGTPDGIFQYQSMGSKRFFSQGKLHVRQLMTNGGNGTDQLLFRSAKGHLIGYLIQASQCLGTFTVHAPDG